MKDKAIGGYHQLELYHGKEYHAKSVRLNSGRNSLEYVLIAKEYTKIYIPFYICNVLIETIEKKKIQFEYYRIDEKLEPIFQFDKIEKNEAFLYINYFGLKDNFISQLPVNRNFIIDNVQAFFSKQVNNFDTFYSPRKFFGVPDGGYLYTNKKIKKLKTSLSHNKMSHLLKRLEVDAEHGYNDYLENEEKFKQEELKKMSHLTRHLLSSIDYDKSMKIRIENYNFLNSYLKKSNLLNIPFNSGVPFVYPYLSKDKFLKSKLQSNRIYTATYWPNILETCQSQTLEYKLANDVVYLPIDQRYNEIDLKRILKIINDEY